jgi:hypothetical protein
MFESAKSSLKKLGPVGNFLSNAITILTTNWGLVVSVIVGLIASSWDWTISFVQRPSAQVGIIVFLAILWTYIGISAVARRNRPVWVRAFDDYAYGLAYEGIGFGLNTDADDAALQIALSLRNVGPGPIKYVIERYDVIIGNRTIGNKGQGHTGFIPRAVVRHCRHPAFLKKDIGEFLGKDVQGTLEVSLVYGHPDRAPTRRLKLNVDLHLNLGKDQGLADVIRSESDEPI